MPRLFLASSSPRRRVLLEQAGVAFDLIEPGPEPRGEGPPAALARLRAEAKARGAQRPQAGWVLGVDTVVEWGGEEFGKPADRAAAAAMLRALAGQTHLVHSGHCLLDLSTGRFRTEVSSARVRFDRLDEPALQSFLDTGAWEGKAGAYGIQDPECSFAHLVEGSLDTVIGMDVQLLRRWLREAQDA